MGTFFRLGFKALQAARHQLSRATPVDTPRSHTESWRGRTPEQIGLRPGRDVGLLLGWKAQSCPAGWVGLGRLERQSNCRFFSFIWVFSRTFHVFLVCAKLRFFFLGRRGAIASAGQFVEALESLLPNGTNRVFFRRAFFSMFAFGAVSWGHLN